VSTERDGDDRRAERQPARRQFLRRRMWVEPTAREFNNAFEWAAHKPEAIRVGVPAEIIQSIKLRKPSDALGAPFGTVVELIREALPQDQ